MEELSVYVWIQQDDFVSFMLHEGPEMKVCHCNGLGISRRVLTIRLSWKWGSRIA